MLFSSNYAPQQDYSSRQENSSRQCRGCRIIPDSARCRSMNLLNWLSVEIVSVQISAQYCTSCSLVNPNIKSPKLRQNRVWYLVVCSSNSGRNTPRYYKLKHTQNLIETHLDSRRTLLRRPYKRFGVHKTLDSYSSDLQRRKTKF